MQQTYKAEKELIEKALGELKSSRRISEALEEELVKVFGERFTNGWELAKSNGVRRYEFKPSGRKLWTVQGRKEEYQVMPDIPFCYCDDYYFRVMDKKRGLCYHIIAQGIAEALNQFEKSSKNDSQYSTITDRWRAKEKSDSVE
jgi:predicted nucleic acid-binding Zn finger protein